MADSLGYKLVIRRRCAADKEEETFTGMVRRLMKGDRRCEADKLETLTWWMEEANCGRKHGGARWTMSG